MFLPSIENLFAGSTKSGPRLDFSWRMIRRKGRPFLLLPTESASARVSLQLYSAQRRRAKIWRALFPVVFHSPAAGFFERVRFCPNMATELIQFLAQQTGVPAEKLPAPAIKFGGLEMQKSRLVLLVCDEAGRPLKVIKVGLDAAGQAATEKEADFLEQLPANILGCIRLVGRFKTANMTAFATNFFPGESPTNDAGLETLFQTWLNSEPAVPVESLRLWQELETAAQKSQHQKETLAVLRSALAGKPVRSTLYHGDFAPWNVRAVNSQNVQAFDWENGQRQGIPGWDWFHFIIQTAILARRLPVERVAAEVEELLQSTRFEKYAMQAGIHEIARPLVLSYLLHHQWVVRPMEGRRVTAQLFELLSTRWNLLPANATPIALPGRPAGAVEQLATAIAQLRNAFWEPSLNSKLRPSLARQWGIHWPYLLVCSLLLAVVGVIHYRSNAHLLFLPFYIIPCIMLTWMTERRWGVLLATVAALLGPTMLFVKDAGFHRWDVTSWNTVMRFAILQMCVLFVDYIRRHRYLFQRQESPASLTPRLEDHWAVVLACGGMLGLVAYLDYHTPPQLIFLPLYILPCMAIALVLNLRWAIPFAALAMAIASLIEYKTNPQISLGVAMGWNFVMRFAISLAILLLLDRIRKENILFYTAQRQKPRRTPSQQLI